MLARLRCRLSGHKWIPYGKDPNRHAWMLDIGWGPRLLCQCQRCGRRFDRMRRGYDYRFEELSEQDYQFELRQRLEVMKQKYPRVYADGGERP